jgi:hypothetical protein
MSFPPNARHPLQSMLGIRLDPMCPSHLVAHVLSDARHSPTITLKVPRLSRHLAFSSVEALRLSDTDRLASLSRSGPAMNTPELILGTYVIGNTHPYTIHSFGSPHVYTTLRILLSMPFSIEALLSLSSIA